MKKQVLPIAAEVRILVEWRTAKRLSRECPAYATELHLADYRTASPNRVARASDSKDLMLATAAFPYVTAFVTNDGYLHGALSYVKKRLPQISTELIRSPEQAV